MYDACFADLDQQTLALADDVLCYTIVAVTDLYLDDVYGCCAHIML